MKKLYLYIGVVIIIFLQFSVVESISQPLDCPAGCTEYEFDFWPDIPECEAFLSAPIHVIYCCCFDASGPGYTATVISYSWPNCFYRDCINSDANRRQLFL